MTPQKGNFLHSNENAGGAAISPSKNATKWPGLCVRSELGRDV